MIDRSSISVRGENDARAFVSLENDNDFCRTEASPQIMESEYRN
jgi:hypothetical protein